MDTRNIKGLTPSFVIDIAKEIYGSMEGFTEQNVQSCVYFGRPSASGLTSSLIITPPKQNNYLYVGYFTGGFQFGSPADDMKVDVAFVDSAGTLIDYKEGGFSVSNPEVWTGTNLVEVLSIGNIITATLNSDVEPTGSFICQFLGYRIQIR